MIYFDFAATTPLDTEAAEIFVKVATEYFGNSNSLHDIGSQAAGLLENCREELASLLGIDPAGLYFTSGGSEGNFLAIEALLSNVDISKNHIITSMAEHSSIHGTMKRLENEGYRITYLPFSPDGRIDPETLKAELTPETALVSIQHVNSEIGSIQPIKEISEICRANQVYLHSDFVQSFGKINLKKAAQFVNSFSFSGHKIYGPKGSGGVYINPQIGWRPFYPGTTHEKGLRPGTVNVPAIAAMTAAAQKVIDHMAEEEVMFCNLRQVFLEKLKPIQDLVTIIQAKGEHQLPSVIGMRISSIEGQLLMLECNREGFAISTGSACQVGMQAPSKTMQALGVPNEEAKEFIRISFGRTTTIEEVENLGETICSIVSNLKKLLS
ncbi:IscS subfamily cysteine desulfurase [Neobacillus sp. PS3-12]|uniref:IscS subfamily cysteine desulfurase n=1 Tax=Neobacillus sp. PS3-12 TaxID=3070677 RepID=UPI0027E0026F|nr:IscS subfamily cysteine desulfurase [Neobacillus sp. PS3-12]WML54184.1 IscS subfamily cysteine desulfurase [Neobacillus sp. PS3-12]